MQLSFNKGEYLKIGYEIGNRYFEEQGIDTEQAEDTASGIYVESYITINEKNFPDANFRAALSKMYDTDGDGRLEADRTYLSVNGKGIKSLKGVELFKSLTHLECSENELTELDLSKNTALISVSCYENKITSLVTISNSKNF